MKRVSGFSLAFLAVLSVSIFSGCSSDSDKGSNFVSSSQGGSGSSDDPKSPFDPPDNSGMYLFGINVYPTPEDPLMPAKLAMFDNNEGVLGNDEQQMHFLWEKTEHENSFVTAETLGCPADQIETHSMNLLVTVDGTSFDMDAEKFHGSCNGKEMACFIVYCDSALLDKLDVTGVNVLLFELEEGGCDVAEQDPKIYDAIEHKIEMYNSK